MRKNGKNPYWLNQGFLLNLLENLPSHVFWKDRDGVYLGCNSVFARSLGLSHPSEIVGKSDYDLPICKEDSDIYRVDDQEVMLSRQAKLNIEEKQRFNNGKEAFLLTSKVPLVDDTQKVLGVLGVYSDITELKNAQSSLLEAKRKAEAASRAKSDFIANMSHDVKTPLSGIISIAESLSLRVPEEYREFAHDILQAGQHLMAFFENCIELSKLENGAIVLSKETFNLRDVATEIIHLFRSTVVAKGVTLHFEYDEKIPKHLLGSRIIFYRILLNLLSNAIKFTSHGAVTIRVELSKKSARRKVMIKLIVLDTGIGIPADKQKLIFDRFTRLSPSYQGTYEGSGIGLYAVKEFVKLVGGKINVKSSEGKGSQFTVELPFEISLQLNKEDDWSMKKSLSQHSCHDLPLSKDHRDKPIISFPPRNLVEQTNFEEISVLLVEDNLLAQKSAKLMLRSLGCKVDVANCGKEAIELFRPGKYNLIFMDIGLPDIKGYNVAAALRNMEKGTVFSAAILGLSAHATEDELQLSAAAGITEMFSKPLLLEQARKIIGQHVGVPHQIVNIVNEELLATENGLRIIDLQKTPGGLGSQEQGDWEMLDELIASLPEARAEIENAHGANNISLLIEKLHKFRGGLHYVRVPHLLQVVSTLETSLRNGQYDKLNILYFDVLKAMGVLEKLYQSLFERTYAVER